MKGQLGGGQERVGGEGAKRGGGRGNRGLMLAGYV